VGLDLGGLGAADGVLLFHTLAGEGASWVHRHCLLGHSWMTNAGFAVHRYVRTLRLEAPPSWLALEISHIYVGRWLLHHVVCLLCLCRYVRTLRLEAPPAWLALAPEAGSLVVHSHADLALRVFTVRLATPSASLSDKAFYMHK